MGYGDDFVIPVSDTQAYKQFGNSVVAKVVERIAQHMQPHIERLILEDKQLNTSLASSGESQSR
jgi:DNA (cytosine-5)-methyltransferase 1